MSYVKTQWVNGDTITADKLNHIETGIEANETENSLLKSQLDAEQNVINWFGDKNHNIEAVATNSILDFAQGQITSAVIGQAITFGSADWIVHYHIAVAYGEVYKITVRRDGSTRYHVVFTDDNDVVIERHLQGTGSGTAQLYTGMFAVPLGATKLYVASQTGSAPQSQYNYIFKCGNPLEDMITTMKPFATHTWENGGFTNGKPYGTDANRIRCLDYFVAPKGTRLYVDYDATTSFYVWEYDFQKATSGHSTSWSTDYTVQNDCYIRLVLRKSSSNPNIDASEFGTLANTVNMVFPTINALMLVESKIADIMNPLPDYWISFMNEKLPSIHENASGAALNGDSFVFFTDYHIEQNSGYTQYLLKDILDKTTINRVFFGGDIYNGTATKSGAIEKANAFIERFSDVPIYGMRGNHEYNWNDGGSALVELSESEIYNEIIKKVEPHIVTNGAMSYYIDNDNRKIRYIIIDGHYERDVTGTPRSVISQDELTWMCDRMTELTSDWSVIIMTHAIYDMTYQNISTIHYTSNGRRIVDAIDSVVGTMDATLACVICGHTHYDYSNTDHGYLIITVTCDSKQDSGQWVPWGSGSGTTNEHAFDVFSVDTVNKTIKTVRIGRGQSRNFTY